MVLLKYTTERKLQTGNLVIFDIRGKFIRFYISAKREVRLGESKNWKSSKKAFLEMVTIVADLHELTFTIIHSNKFCVVCEFTKM